MVKEINLKSGRLVKIRALGMLSIRNLTGALTVMPRDESTPEVSDGGADENIDKAIAMICAGAVEPVFQNTMEPDPGCLSVDDLSLAEFNELAVAIADHSGLSVENAAGPLSGTKKN